MRTCSPLTALLAASQSLVAHANLGENVKAGYKAGYRTLTHVWGGAKDFGLDQRNRDVQASSVDGVLSVVLVLEPLLLFDTVFLEDRPLVELIAPNFSYQSDFLKTWYTTDLQPPPIPAEEIVAQNQRNDVERARLQALIDTNQAELDALIEPSGCWQTPRSSDF